MSISYEELVNFRPTGSFNNVYKGPTVFEGEQINQEHSPKSFVKTVLNYLGATGFVGINLIGNMGTGKTTCATMIAHLWHEIKPETTIIWAGSDELKRLTEFLEGLDFGRDYLIIFDDSSNILDTLSGDQVSEAFNSYTKSRHTLGSKLGVVLIYHYTFSMKKNFRSSGTYTIYTSCSLTEYGNIYPMISNFRRSVRELNNFVKVFNGAYQKDPPVFDVDIGNGNRKWFTRDKPFRFDLVITTNGAHLMAVKEMSCSYCISKQIAKKLPARIIYDKITEKYPKYGPQALGFICYNKGNKTATPKELRRVLNFAFDFLKEHPTDYDELSEIVRQSRKLPDTRDYRNRKEEEDLAKEILDGSKAPTKQEPSDFDPQDPFNEDNNDLDKEFDVDEQEGF